MTETVTLKEHFEKILSEKDKALAAALIAVKEENRKTEIAAEKRFELLNELRSGVATKDQYESLDKSLNELKARIDKTEGSGAGIQKFIGWIIAAIAVAAFVIKSMN